MIEHALYGLFFGLILAMLLYNLLLYLSLKDISYLYYIIAMGAGAFIALIRSGYSITYFWPENVLLDLQVYLIFGGLSIMASSRFVSHFLGLPNKDRSLDWYLWGITVLGFGLIVATFFYSYVELTSYGRFLTLVAIPSYLIVAFLAWRKGYRFSKFFMLAWFPYVIGIALIVIRGAGWISYHPLVEVSAEIGTSLEAILLSLALADRINSYKMAKVEAEKKSFQSELEKQSLISENRELDHELELKDKDLHHEERLLATSTLWLTQKNTLLKNIQSLLKTVDNEAQDGFSVEIDKMISQSLHAEDDWVRFKDHLEKVHIGFFTTLKKSFPQLTPNEERMCAYIRMNLSPKEISRLLNISPDSVKKNRHCLRKKLNITDINIDLLSFLQDVS